LTPSEKDCAGDVVSKEFYFPESGVYSYIFPTTSYNSGRKYGLKALAITSDEKIFYNHAWDVCPDRLTGNQLEICKISEPPVTQNTLINFSAD